MSTVTVVLIPAYEPDTRLVDLVRALRAADADRPVVVVDDGSGDAFEPVFAEAEASGAVVVAHPWNRGKGAALKTGFAHIAEHHSRDDVVTADADGQHTPRDVERVSARLARRGDVPSVVLGVRAFSGTVPARSRFGNAVTRTAFRLATGRRVSDTQTGLRGVPHDAVEWARTIRGDRFDYEFRMLLHASSAGLGLVEVPIATVYTDGNSSSHFRPVVDSLRVYAPLARFGASALFAFLVDAGALLLLHALTGWLFFSVVIARILSAGINFAVNRRLVFPRAREVALRTAAARYCSLAALLLAANFGLLTALTDAGLPLLAAKLLTDVGLFAVSFAVQRAVVFAPATQPRHGAGQSERAGWSEQIMHGNESTGVVVVSVLGSQRPREDSSG